MFSRKRRAPDSEADLVHETEIVRHVGGQDVDMEILDINDVQESSRILHRVGTYFSGMFNAVRNSAVFGSLRGAYNSWASRVSAVARVPLYEVVEYRRREANNFTVKRFKRLPSVNGQFRSNDTALPVEFANSLPAGAFDWTSDVTGHLGVGNLQAVIYFLEGLRDDVRLGRLVHFGTLNRAYGSGLIDPEEAIVRYDYLKSTCNVPLSILIYNSMIKDHEASTWRLWRGTSDRWFYKCMEAPQLIAQVYNDFNVRAFQNAGLTPTDGLKDPAEKDQTSLELRCQFIKASQFLHNILTHRGIFDPQTFPAQTIAGIIVDLDALHKEQPPPSFVDWPGKYGRIPGEWPEASANTVLFDDVTTENVEPQRIYDYKWCSPDKLSGTALASTDFPVTPRKLQEKNRIIYVRGEPYPAKGALKNKHLGESRAMKKVKWQSSPVAFFVNASNKPVRALRFDGPSTFRAPSPSTASTISTPSPAKVANTFRVPSPSISSTVSTPSPAKATGTFKVPSPVSTTSTVRTQSSARELSPRHSPPPPNTPTPARISFSAETPPPVRTQSPAKEPSPLHSSPPPNTTTPARTSSAEETPASAKTPSPATPSPIRRARYHMERVREKKRRKIRINEMLKRYGLRPSQPKPNDETEYDGDMFKPRTPSPVTARTRRTHMSLVEFFVNDDAPALPTGSRRAVPSRPALVQMPDAQADAPARYHEPEPEADTRPHSSLAEINTLPPADMVDAQAEPTVITQDVSSNAETVAQSETSVIPDEPKWKKALDKLFAAEDAEGGPQLQISSFKETELAIEKQLLEDAAYRRAREIEAEKRRREEEEQRAAEEERRREEEQRVREEDEHLARTGGLRQARRPIVPTISEGWETRVMNALEARSNAELAKTPEGIALTRRDFEQVVPENVWLNDEIINSALLHLSNYVNGKAGIKNTRTQTPKIQVFNSFFGDKIATNGAEGTQRVMRRVGIKKDTFLQIETILIPVNRGHHWTLMVVRPKYRTVSHVDSLNSRGSSDLTTKALKWVKMVLEEKFVAAEWTTKRIHSPQQRNLDDCGIHAITNGICIGMGIDPATSYSASDMPMQRHHIAAVCLNGGFNKDFDLGGI